MTTQRTPSSTRKHRVWPLAVTAISVSLSILTPPGLSFCRVLHRAPPAEVVKMISASFTKGEHLEHISSVNDAAHGYVYVGGDITDATGKKLSSQDTWLVRNGSPSLIWAMTRDARERTTFADGRNVAGSDWTTFNDQLGECVGQAGK